MAKKANTDGQLAELPEKTLKHLDGIVAELNRRYGNRLEDSLNRRFTREDALRLVIGAMGAQMVRLTDRSLLKKWLERTGLPELEDEGTKTIPASWGKK